MIVTTLLAALVVAEPRGLLGQSQPEGSESVTWMDCSWVVADQEGNAHLPGGWMVPDGSTAAVKVKKTVEGLVFAADHRSYFCRDRYKGQIRRVKVAADGIEDAGPFCAFPEWNWVHAVKPYTAAGRVRLVALDTKKQCVYGWDDEGKPLGVALDYSKSPIAKLVTSVGFEAKTGDILLGTRWPERKTHRFSADGSEVKDGFFPCAQCSESGFAYAGGRTWACGGGVVEINPELGAGRSALSFGGVNTTGTRAAARVRHGWWFATELGAYYCRDGNPGVCEKRVGGFTRPNAIALVNGVLVAVKGNRFHGLRLDDYGDEPLFSTASDWWTIGYRWGRDEVSLVKPTGDGRFLLREDTAKKTWSLDLSITDYPSRPKRMHMTEEKFADTDPRHATAGEFDVVVEAKEIAIYSGADHRKVGSIPVKASLVAAEGRWIVAYLPERNGFVKYRLRKNFSGKRD